MTVKLAYEAYLCAVADYRNGIALWRLATMTHSPARYDQCDDTCTVDCGHCKGQGPPATSGRLPEIYDGTTEAEAEAMGLASEWRAARDASRGSPDYHGLRALAEKAMPGPWGWTGQDDGSVELTTLHSGHQRIITTVRSSPCLVELPGECWSLTADACDSCKAEAAKDFDPFVDYRCPKPANLNTVWLLDHDAHVIKPANTWAVREQPYRGDVARVEHPEAAFIAACTPDVVLALLDKIDGLNREVKLRGGTW